MILAFKEQFKAPIMSGSKIHSIRADKPNRWKLGMMIHFATGVRTPKYDNFKMGQCVSVEEIEIEYISKVVPPIIKVGGRNLLTSEKYLLAKKDGFDDLEDFLQFFSEDFKGKIIHWTDFKYNK